MDVYISVNVAELNIFALAQEKKSSTAVTPVGTPLSHFPKDGITQMIVGSSAPLVTENTKN